MPLTRRDVLLGGVLTVTAAACTSGGELALPPPPDPDLALQEAALLRERTLLAAYDAALVAHPSLSAILTPLRADHATHLDRLTALLLGAPSASAAPSQLVVPMPATAATPAAQRAALRALERSIQAAHRDAAITASRALAPVLASLAACEASHAVVV